MSEQILDPQGDSGGRPVLPPVPGAQDGRPKGASRRLFLIVGGSVIGGLILGGVVLMNRSSQSEGADTIVVQAESQTGAWTADEGSAEGGDGQADAAKDGEEAGDVVTVSRTKVRITSRDPFAPIVAKAPEPTPTPTAKGVAASEPTTPQKTGGATISALAISRFEDSATLKLDGKKYSVDEGEEFAKSYRMYDIFNDNCAGFLYGDQNAVVCEGDSVTIG